MDGVPDDGLLTVACPVCDRGIRVSLPRSHEILSIEVDPEDSHSRHTETMSRRREIQDACPNGHVISVVCEW